MKIATIDREVHTFRFVGRSYLISLLLNVACIVVVCCGLSVRLITMQNSGAALVVCLISLVLLGIRLVVFFNRAQRRLIIKGDEIQLFTGKQEATIVQSLRNVENLTIRIKGGAIGIASWRRIDFKDGKSIIFDGQVENVEQLEDLLTERSGKQFLRWLTGEAYQKPKV